MSIPVRIRDDVAAQVGVVAEVERRSLANMVEVLLLAALAERGGLVRTGVEPCDGPAGLGGGVPAPRAAAPRSVSSDVAATIPGVQLLRPHMRKDRPAIECSNRVPAGVVCLECGA